MKMNRRALLLGSAAVLLLPTDVEAWRIGGGSILVEWNNLVTNGGGLLPGLSIADDGTKTCYTDTAGGYIYDDVGGRWNQMASWLQNNNPNQFEWTGYRGMAGLADCQIAPSNSNYIYYLMADNWYNGNVGRAFLSKSTDKGLTSTIQYST